MSDDHQNSYDVALAIIMTVRNIEGADVKGVGPDIDTLKAHEFLADFDDAQILSGAQQAERRGWINLQAALGKPIIGVTILEAGQAYLDDMAM
jgi:hypothetical protein|tara:strand:- start:2856 stop:3134 length:279 start_codon:yes stop_codon:yes gene_type:complete